MEDVTLEQIFQSDFWLLKVSVVYGSRAGGVDELFLSKRADLKLV